MEIDAIVKAPEAWSQTRAAFERDGYVVIERALEPDHVERLIEAVDRVYARLAEPGKALHMLAFLGEDPLFLELIDNPATMPLMAEILGLNIFCFHCHLDVHPPEPEGRQPWMWHQDGSVANRDLESDPRPRLSAKLAYFLTDVSEPGRGNFAVIPGSQVNNRIDRPPDDDNEIPGTTPVLARSGDAVLFDRRLWHMRSPNRSDITRKAIFYAYTFRWVRERDDMTIPPEFEPLITPVRAQLLGRAERAIDRWMPDEVEPPLKAALA